MPRETVTPVFGTSANLIVSFGWAQIASERSLPTLPSTTSNAAVNSMSRTWYPPRFTCMRPGHELVVRRVLVVLDALEQRVGAVADADDRDAHLVLRARAAVAGAVGGGHGVLSVGDVRDLERVREGAKDELVDGGAALGGRVLEDAAQRDGQAQHDDAGRAGDHLAAAAARGERRRRSGRPDARPRRRSGSSRGGRPRGRAHASAPPACGR